MVTDSCDVPGVGSTRRCVPLQRRAGVWQQGHEAGALDGLAEQALFAGAGAEALAAQDLAVGAHQAAEVLDILPINNDGALGVGVGDAGLGGIAETGGELAHGNLKPASWS